ncbi:MAG: CHAT domain-containing protein, partial [Cyanobacteria bacterium J06632_3]
SERRPSHGNFQPGDFTKLFQNVLHTVDLIFREGLDMSAFMSAFQQVQDHQAQENSGENGNGLMSVRSIENKGDGVVVVKVEVPETAEKPQIQAALTQEYEQALNQLESRYQAELALKDAQIESKDAQIELYKQHQSDLTQLTKLLTQPPPSQSSDSAVTQAAPVIGKRVVLRLGLSEAEGIPVTLQIADEGGSPQLETTGWLPSAQVLLSVHQNWQQAYQQMTLHLSGQLSEELPGAVRLEVAPVQITNVSYGELFERCRAVEEALYRQVNAWLDSEPFRPVREALLMSLEQSMSVRFFLQTDDSQIRALPLHLWQWFDRYSRAELVLSEANYRQISTVAAVQPMAQQDSAILEDTQIGKVKILAVLGDSKGLDIERDRTLLSQLPDVELTCLVEPMRAQLNDTLWSQPWDILFFAGHSTFQNEQQQLRINASEGLSLNELKYALKKATERGLKLAILNACDGLQLLHNLKDAPSELLLPPTIVMRYPVPDVVAQTFLKYFLSAFSQGIPLHQAVRDAREQLQGIESQFPFATWLPVLHQNPASPLLTWSKIKAQ